MLGDVGKGSNLVHPKQRELQVQAIPGLGHMGCLQGCSRSERTPKGGRGAKRGGLSAKPRDVKGDG